jgi:hypothetical protein
MHSVIIVAWFWAQLLVNVIASPVSKPASIDIGSVAVYRPDRDLRIGDPVVQNCPGDAPDLRAVYTALSLLCMSLMAGMVGRRAYKLPQNSALMVQGLACAA